MVQREDDGERVGRGSGPGDVKHRAPARYQRTGLLQYYHEHNLDRQQQFFCAGG